MGGRYGQGIAGTQQPPAISGRDGQQGHATPGQKEAEGIEGAPNCYPDIFFRKKFTEHSIGIDPLPTCANTGKVKMAWHS